jgi:hypothetical protein
VLPTFQKLVTAYDAVDILRKGISIFGAHGIIEDFCVDVFRVYQETALREVGPEPLIGSRKMSKPEIWR